MIRIIILAFIIFLPTLAQSQEPSPTPLKTIGNPKKHPTKIDNATNNCNRGTEQNPIFIKELSPEIRREGRAAEAKDRYQKATYERWTVVSTITIAAFTVIMGITTILLWKETKKTARFTGLTVATMKDTAERQLRAYLSSKIVEIPVNIDDHGKLSVTTTVKNYGNTPAHSMMGSNHIGIYNLPITDTNPLDKVTLADEISKSSIAPGEVYYMTITLKKQFTQNDISIIESGGRALFLVGEIKYVDVFGKQHSSKCCLISTGETFKHRTFSYYHEGNEED